MGEAKRARDAAKSTGWPASPPVPEGWRELRDDARDVVIRYHVESHSVQFKVRTGCDQGDGQFLYNCMIDDASNMTEDFDKGERLVDGYIKWDGCSHMNFGDEGTDGYIHLCGTPYFEQLVWVLREMMRIAARELPAFDADCADFAALGAS